MGRLHLVRSNRMEHLVEAYLGQGLSEDPFEVEEILVGSAGMQEWLHQQLAQRRGLSANVRWSRPGRIVRLVEEALRVRPAAREPDGEEDDSPWTPDRLVWPVASALVQIATTDSDPVWDPLRSYLAFPTHEGVPVVDRKAWRLARELADMFDRYLHERPAMIEIWAAGRAAAPTARRLFLRPAPEAPIAASLQWQPALWERVGRAVREASGGAPHLVDQLASLRAATDRAELPGHAHLPRRIALFGVAQMRAGTLMALRELARFLRVEWYLLTPTPHFLLDQTPAAVERRRRYALAGMLDGPGERLAPTSDEGAPTIDALPDPETDVNPFIAAFGRVVRSTQLQIEELVEDYAEPRSFEGFVDPADEPVDEGAAGARVSADRPPSMLARLQRDVYALESEAYRVTPESAGAAPTGDGWASRVIAPGDRSIGFHACGGALRQVEALRDVIVELLDADPTLEPRDILVMTPDVAAMAAPMLAVFGEHARNVARDPSGIPMLPLRIRDQSIRATNPVAEALVRLLRFRHARATVSEVVGLLDLAPVQQRFALDAADGPTLEGWFRDAGVRWGWDADHRRAEGLDLPVDRLAWAEALDRLALGVFRPDDAVVPSPARGAGRRPFGPLGPDQRDLAGRALGFVEAVAALPHELAQPRTRSAWVEWLLSEDPDTPGLIPRFCLAAPSRAWQVAQVVDALRALADLEDDGTWIDAGALEAWLAGRFDRPARLEDGGMGAITFCSLVPARSLPFRVICLLGMDDDVFPRRGRRTAWDLVARFPHWADRNPRDEDRHLFLESVLSARDALHIFYSGVDPRRNTERRPAAPVAELGELLGQRFDRVGDAKVEELLTRRWPLQNVASRAFDDGGPTGWRSRHAALHEAARVFDAVRHDPALRESAALRLELAPDPAGPSPEPVEMETLERWLLQPVTTTLKEVAKVAAPREEDAVDDLLPLDPGKLVEWQMRDDLLRTPRQHRAALFETWRLDPRLPPGDAAELALVKLTETAAWYDRELEGHGVSGGGDEVRVELRTSHGPRLVRGATGERAVAKDVSWVWRPVAKRIDESPHNVLAPALEAVMACLALGVRGALVASLADTKVHRLDVHAYFADGEASAARVDARARAWIAWMVRGYDARRTHVPGVFPKASASCVAKMLSSDAAGALVRAHLVEALDEDAWSIESATRAVARLRDEGHEGALQSGLKAAKNAWNGHVRPGGSSTRPERLSNPIHQQMYGDRPWGEPAIDAAVDTESPDENASDEIGALEDDALRFIAESLWVWCVPCGLIPAKKSTKS